MADQAFEATDFARPRGTEACRHDECEQHDAVRCNYVDTRGRQCGTAWCPDHWRAVGGVVYCRRHANTIVALGDRASDPLTLPDLDNRGPSLVNWVYRDLDDEVRTLLGERGGATERVIRDSAVTVVIDAAHHRTWERSWKLFDALGDVVHRITVVVADSDDALVTLRVDNTEVSHGVPPWIDRHRRNVDVTHTVDKSQRKIFYSFLIENVAGVLSGEAISA